jgi:hypothetical protein
LTHLTHLVHLSLALHLLEGSLWDDARHLIVFFRRNPDIDKLLIISTMMGRSRNTRRRGLLHVLALSPVLPLRRIEMRHRWMLKSERVGL